MLDAREPKNGDFARYVEELTSHPPLPRHAPAQKSPEARPPEPAPAAVADGAWGRSAAPEPARPEAANHHAGSSSPATLPPALAQALERATHASPQARAQARATFSRLLERIAAIAVFAGIAMIATSFSDDPPFFADPFTGIVLLVGAGMANRLRKKLNA